MELYENIGICFIQTSELFTNYLKKGSVTALEGNKNLKELIGVLCIEKRKAKKLNDSDINGKCFS